MDATHSQDVEAPVGRHVEILLVEDNPNDVKLTLHAFKRNNLANRVHVVSDGAEALEFLFCTGAYEGRDAANRPKIVLLDLKLPKVDGIEVLRKVKANAATRTIPVVVLTSSREERDIVESYELGVNSYIVKPVDFDAFAATIAQVGMYWMIANEAPD